MSSTPYGLSRFSKTSSYMAMLSWLLMLYPATPCRQVPAVTPVKSNLSPSIINLDKQPASHTNTADSNQLHTAHHTATQMACWIAVSEDASQS